MVIEVMNMGMIYLPPRKDAEQWLKSLGCKISKEGDSTPYCPISIEEWRR